MNSDFLHASDLVDYLKSNYDFCVLGACYPECHPESSNCITDIKGLKTKVDAGCEVLISQLFFENMKFRRFSEKCKIAGIDVPVIPGIMPVINAGQIRRMIGMCNASFPDRFVRIINKYGENLCFKPDHRSSGRGDTRCSLIYNEQSCCRQKNL